MVHFNKKKQRLGSLLKNGMASLMIILFACVFTLPEATAQMTIRPGDTTVCPGDDYWISGSFASTFSLGAITQDDYFGGVVDIGFPFEFYGQTYTQCVISANNFITFDLSKALQYSSWVYNTALTSGDLDRAIMFPYADVNMGLGLGVISYQTQGVAPFRRFIVEFCQCPLFSCNTPVTNQAILYENTNIVEIHITENPTCVSWQNGTAIEGLRGAPNEHLVPGRNLINTPWTTTNDAHRFTPNGPNKLIRFLTILLWC